MPPRSARRSRSTAGSTTARGKESAGSLLRFVLMVAIIAWAFRSFVYAPFNIPSGSMLPTLYIGDYLVVSKWPYGFSRYSFPLGIPSFEGRIFSATPKRGDVVVFRHPGEDSDLIKRVIGLPGDTVAVRDGRLILNGRLVPRRSLPPAKVPVTANSPCRMVPPASPTIVRQDREALCVYTAFLEMLPGSPAYTVVDQVDHGAADDFTTVTVPAAHVFLMGDNRDDSLDSRYSQFEGGIGMVPMENLIGRASFTFWSTDGSASWVRPWTWFNALRASRIGNGYWGAAE